ncbi:unnamed protein product [Candida verbasci]|uniref:BRCT domain-containing protein n=1 Tax=Candida verbasci TaxID=1227364 RepID=A0A9W4TUR4_9ASCO|nr:unnamed protein product [Candida verbasci]
MFDHCTFLIIVSEDLSTKEYEKLYDSLISNYATKIYFKPEHDTSKNYMNPPSITNIITANNHIDFIEYQDAKNSMLSITTPDWVYESMNANKLLSYKNYNPDPSFFFKDLFICCSDNLPDGDRELIYGAVKAFGGNYLDALTKYTTHLISQDLGNEKAIIANSIIPIQVNSNDSKQPVSIKIVQPEWIEHCITMGKKIKEDSYILQDFTNNNLDLCLGYQNTSDGIDHMDDDSEGFVKLSNKESPNSLDFILNKNFFISSDFNLSPRLSTSVRALINKFGGAVQDSFDENSLDIYLGKYRSGEYYQKASLNKNVIVGNLLWLYTIMVNKKWILPLNSNILNYPIPPNPLKAFKNLKISISNYSGDSRKYLTKLISILGGTFTKTLSKENDILICARREGKKYDAAKKKWINEGAQVKVVNHLWLEDCFVNWSKLDESSDKYINFGNENLGMEPLIGRVKLNEVALKRWYLNNEFSSEADMTSNIDDSMSEDECTQSRKEKEETQTQLKVRETSIKEEKKEHTTKDDDTQFSSDSEEEENGDNSVQPQPLVKNENSTIVKPTSSQIRDVQQEVSNYMNSSPYKKEPLVKDSLFKESTPQTKSKSRTDEDVSKTTPSMVASHKQADESTQESSQDEDYPEPSTNKKESVQNDLTTSQLEETPPCLKDSDPVFVREEIQASSKKITPKVKKEKTPTSKKSKVSKDQSPDTKGASPTTPSDNSEPTLPLIQPASHSRYGGRSAAKKAALKLHDNMSDLNQYQQVKKSNKKMQSYFDNLNNASLPSSSESNSNSTSKRSLEESEESPVSKKQYQIIAIMTGSDIELTKTDYSKLKDLGIIFITDFSSPKSPNILFAPKLLRTEKFLRSLSKVNKIIHPKYLTDLLSEENKENNLNINDYSLEKIDPSTETELNYENIGNSTAPIFHNLNFNLSINLNGGIDVISRILKDHGMKDYKEIKQSTKLKDEKNIMTNKDNDEKTILIANKSKDTKLINNFKKEVDDSIVLNWNWCVKSIFQMELQDYEEYKV